MEINRREQSFMNLFGRHSVSHSSGQIKRVVWNFMDHFIIDVLKVRKRFVWIREKAQKPRMVLNLLPVSLPKFTTLRA